jgi:hypothetical protein
MLNTVDKNSTGLCNIKNLIRRIYIFIAESFKKNTDLVRCRIDVSIMDPFLGWELLRFVLIKNDSILKIYIKVALAAHPQAVVCGSFLIE